MITQKCTLLSNGNNRFYKRGGSLNHVLQILEQLLVQKQQLKKQL
jgi:hypothetical protein